MQLSTNAFTRARQFLIDQGRALDLALYRHHFEAPCPHEVVAELKQFQNSDGGFGHALEPDFRLPESSVMATTIALQAAVTLDLDATHQLVADALTYLETQFDAALNAWPPVPASVNDHPHAPWWHQDPSQPPDAAALRRNPGAEVAGYLIRWGRGRFGPWVTTLVDTTNELEPHELLCFIRLAQTPGLASGARERLHKLIKRHAPAAIETDASKWGSYSIKPLTAAETPNSLLAGQFAEAIQRNLDYEIERQSADGSWGPHWTWGTSDPEGWALSKPEWTSDLTLKTLLGLAAFGRIQLPKP